MKKLEKGFTLVEFIVILFILVTISAIIVGVVYSTLRGSSRAQSTVNVSSSGNFALSAITGVIIHAEDVLEVGGAQINDCTNNPQGESIVLRGGDGGVTELSCTEDTISSNSASLIDSFELRVLPESCSFVCSQDSPYDAPVIEVDFSLESRTSELQTDNVLESFSTSAVMRNFSL